MKQNKPNKLLSYLITLCLMLGLLQLAYPLTASANENTYTGNVFISDASYAHSNVSTTLVVSVPGLTIDGTKVTLVPVR